MFHRREEAEEWNGQYPSDKPKVGDEEVPQNQKETLERNINNAASGSIDVVSSSISTFAQRDLSTSDVDRKRKKRDIDVVDEFQLPKIQMSTETGSDLVVYCDGACKGNGKPGSIAGVGVWWGHDDERNIAERCPGAQTNNRAELLALGRVLESTPVSRRKLVIKSDSKYTINCFEKWIHKWYQNGFVSSTGKPVANAPLIRYVHTLLESRINLGQRVRIDYVKGHSGDVGNDGADAQANIGATKCEVEERDWGQLEEHYKKEVRRIMEILEESDSGLRKAEVEVVGSDKIEDEVEVETVDGDNTVESPSKRRRISEEGSAQSNPVQGAIPGPFTPSKPKSERALATKSSVTQSAPNTPSSPSKPSSEARKLRLAVIAETLSPKTESDSNKQSRLAIIQANLSPTKSKSGARVSDGKDDLTLTKDHHQPPKPNRPTDALSPKENTTGPPPDVSSSSSLPQPAAGTSLPKDDVMKPTSSPFSSPSRPREELTPRKRRRLALIQEALLSSSETPTPEPNPIVPRSPSKTKAEFAGPKAKGNTAVTHTNPEVANELSKDDLEAFAQVWNDDISSLSQ
ncbi:hypothetical protein K435DRAFT_848971 [Dendrothele bispora CBS 962.96]|uniref:ribonuclease H n=1 Tax=Dendrothele bispora (strain CBS 962.96) TaxID=1314807 RepID=A0A4S8MTH4_DENBC|nr:hypothetical protein K435DRAFT_848971 [Dendrothele bispora CBS 962.96]